MNCDECKEQIFELIEQETIDPDGVRALLARCPDCHSLFDETKAALRTAAMLPLEEPPLSIDAAIVRAAAERVPTQRLSRWRRLQAAPWAMAAVALLALGIGVWTIPRGGELEGSDGFVGKREAHGELIARDELGDASSQDPVIAALEPAPARAIGGAEANIPATGLETASRRSTRAKQRAGAPVAPAVARQAAGARKASPEAATPRLAAQERKEDAIAACQRRVAEHEGAEHDEADATIDAEQALALGECYQKLGKKTKARRWLTRAAGEPVTKLRAEQALRGLDAK
jgi:hypothetical protein